MKKIQKYFSKYSIYLLMASIFFIRLPPFYIFPVSSSLTLSTTISRILILFLLAFILFEGKMKKLPRIPSVVILVWFVSQTASVLPATNITQFLGAYKDIVFALMLFFVTFTLVNKNNIVVVIQGLLITTVCSLFLQLWFYVNPGSFFTLVGSLLYEKYSQFLNYQTMRSRFFGDSFDETMIPLIVLLFSRTKKTVQKVGSVTLMAIITFITYASNWRSKTLVFVFSLFFGLFNIQSRMKQIFVLIIIFICIGLISDFVSRQIIGRNIVDRLVYADETEYSTIASRYNYWGEAYDMGIGSPLLGVGLGHFYEHLSVRTQLLSLSSYVDRFHGFITIDDPHNIFFSTFAQTGFVGLISLLIMTSYFFISDITIYLKKRDQTLTAFSTVYWSLFLFSLFNPWLYFSYLGFLWFIRGVIEALKYDNSK